MSIQRAVAGLHLPARPNLSCCALAVACLAWCGGSQPAWASQATQTTLSVTSGGNLVSSVAGGTVVTLTATVQAGGAALKLGQVNFCDATAASCADIHLAGTAQLTSAGTAVLRFRPGPGSHSYKAVFLGTQAGAAGASATVGLTVGPPAGPQTTYTTASISGPVTSQAADTYALTANVATKGKIPPSGTVSFSGIAVATGNAFSVSGTATLGPLSGGPGFLIVPMPEPTGEADAPPVTAVADFNGDGIPDIVFSPKGGVAVSLGNGDGTFAAPVFATVDEGDGINAFAVGDFNGDGNTDLLVADEDTGQLTVLLGKGDGTFTVGQSMPCCTFSIAVADFNGDGKLDVALPGSIETTILLGNGDGTFTAAPASPQIGGFQVVAADFKGDGKIDLAVASYNQTTFTNTPITILLGNGDGTFTAAPNQPQVVASQLVAADFNGDGKIDLAALDPIANTVTILMGNGDSTFMASTPFPSGSQVPYAGELVFGYLALGDFNGDGKSDLVVSGTGNAPEQEATFFAGNGDGTFAAGLTVPDGIEQLAVADLTGSGSSDAVTLGSVILTNLTVTTATADNVLPPGYDTIQADYPGDANYSPSSSTNEPTVFVQQQVASLTSSPVSVAPGTEVSGNFSVTAVLSGNYSLSCSISAPQGHANPPTCFLPTSSSSFGGGQPVNEFYNVTAQATTPFGQYSVTITATYVGQFAEPPASTSTTVTVGAQNVRLTNSGATIASPGASGSSTITITPTGGYAGQVTMSCTVTDGPSGAVDPPTCTIPSPISVASSPVTTMLTLNTQPATSPGNYAVTVTGASAGSINATTGFTVAVPVAPPGFALSGTAVSIASPGPSATSTITITPGGGFTGTVALSCGVTGGPTGGTDAPTCSVTAPPAIAGAAAVTAMLTVNTTAASTAANSHPAIRNQLPSRDVAMGSSVIALASLLWFGFPIRRQNKLTLLGLLLVSILLGATMGCGGTNAPAPPANPGTTPGAYTAKVTGSSGSIVATTAVTVTVN